MKKLVSEYDPAIAAGFISSWEHFEPKAYKDVVGYWTIGFGTTRGVHPDDTITYEEAWGLMVKDIARFQKQAAPFFTEPVTPNQFVAIMSFVYNLGAGVLPTATWVKKLNAGDIEGAAETIQWFNKGGRPKVVIKGLARRRAAEAALILREEDFE